jgi:hypothetical protein
MRTFMFLCPNTGYIVQAQADGATPGEKPHTFHLVSCASCGRRHLLILQRLSLRCVSGRSLLFRNAI